MKVSHPDFAHMSNSSITEQEVPVHTVMSPEDEATFQEEMKSLEDALTKDQSEDDPAIEEEKKKRGIFDKLVLFKEPVYKEFEINGVPFKFKLLTSSEMALVLKYVNRIDLEDRPGKLGLMTIAAALVDVGGQKLEDVVEAPAEITSPTLRKYWEMSQWNSAVVNTLVSVYSNFRKEVEGKYGADFLGKSPKTPPTG